MRFSLIKRGCRKKVIIISGLEIEELSRRMAAMTDEEQIIAARNIKDEILFKEIERRSITRRSIIEIIENSLKLQDKGR